MPLISPPIIKRLGNPVQFPSENVNSKLPDRTRISQRTSAPHVIDLGDRAVWGKSTLGKKRNAGIAQVFIHAQVNPRMWIRDGRRCQRQSDRPLAPAWLLRCWSWVTEWSGCSRGIEKLGTEPLRCAMRDVYKGDIASASIARRW